MSRAAILPTPGDPFLFNYWINNFNKYWRDEVDNLYIYINSPIEKEAMEYMLSKCVNDSKITIFCKHKQIEHGEAIRYLLEDCEQDLVVLVEDDSFVFKKGKIDECFRRIEMGEADAVGGKRGSCSMEVWERARDVFGLDYSGFGDQGPNFWPCYFFIKKETLLNTDRNFGAKNWKRGEIIESLNNYKVRDENCANDTFVNTSLQLRKMGLRFHYEPQYHGSPNDLSDYAQRVNLWDGQAAWTHVGSLSSGIGGVLMDDFGRSLARRKIDEPVSGTIIPNYCNTDAERLEWERRIQWWLTFYENSEPEELRELREEYRKAIMRVIDRYKLSFDNIKRRQMIYSELGL